MSFETEAKLTLTVDEGNLRNVQQQIEEGIGTTAVGVTDGGSMSAQSAGSSGSGRGRRARRSMRLAETRTEHLEDAVFYLESIDDAVSEGGLGGGGGLFAELLGIGGDLGAEAAGTAAETATGLATDVAGTAIGQAAGGIIAREISGSSVSVEGISKPPWVPLRVQKPEWKIGVERPTDGLDGPVGGPLPIPDIPPLEVPDIPSIDAPESISVDRDPLPVENTTLAVENTTLPVEDTTLPVEDVGPITVAVDIGGVSGKRGGGSNRGAIQRAGGALDDIGARVAEFITGKDAPPSITEPLGEGGTPAGRPGETIGRLFDTTNPLTSGGFGSGSGSGGSGGTQLDVSVTHSPTYRVDVDPRKLDQMVSDIVSEIESNVERDIGELEQEIDDLRSNLDSLERDIRRNR
jgi:hypothetical protein